MADHAKPERHAIDCDDVWVRVHTEDDPILSIVKAAAKEVYDVLGTGHNESVYKYALGFELQTRGHTTYTEFPLIVWYKGLLAGVGRADIVLHTACCVCAVLELKQVSKITPAHEAQTRAYARSLGGGARAFVVNFGPESVEVRSVVV